MPCWTNFSYQVIISCNCISDTLKAVNFTFSIRILQQCPHIKDTNYQRPARLDNDATARNHDKHHLPHLETVQVTCPVAAKQAVHEFDIPHLRLLNISINVGSLRNSPRWPQLRVLRLDGRGWEELIFQDIPIAHMPCLEPITISPVLVNDAFLSAVGCLSCLEDLYLESPSYRSYGDPSWSEQAVLRMLRGCGRWQRLRINDRELISGRVPDPIADIAVAGRLTDSEVRVSIARPSATERSAQSLFRHCARTLFPTEIGLRRFTYRVADSQLALLRLRVYDDCSDEAIEFITSKLGYESVVNRCNH